MSGWDWILSIKNRALVSGDCAFTVHFNIVILPLFKKLAKLSSAISLTSRGKIFNNRLLLSLFSIFFCDWAGREKMRRNFILQNKKNCNLKKKQPAFCVTSRTLI